MDIKTKTIDVNNLLDRTNVNNKKVYKSNNSDVKFFKELDKKFEELENIKNEDLKQDVSKTDTSDSDKEVQIENNNSQSDKNMLDGIDNAINGLNDILDQINALNQTDDITNNTIKLTKENDDINNDNQKDIELIDNNMNVPEPQEKIILSDSANMNFNSNEQPFSSFVKQATKDVKLKSTQSDLAEEQAILSTMEENIAIANKNMALSKTKTVENEHGVQKVDKKTNLVIDTIVSYDSVVMNKADVEFFANLVENGIVDLNEVQGAEKSSRVSKVLADLLAKAMSDNKPVRIDFDNNISVIIKIDKAGKISADFLPSSQVAEAYLKENLPLLRQRFDDNNIDYNELNQRQRKQQDTQDNKKKGQKDE